MSSCVAKGSTSDVYVCSPGFGLLTSVSINWSQCWKLNGSKYEYILVIFKTEEKYVLVESFALKALRERKLLRWCAVWLWLVCFRYTYGKPVKGTVTVTCLPVSYWKNKKNITKTLEVGLSLVVLQNPRLCLLL